MQDIISYGKSPSEPTLEQTWALQKIQEYQYRQMFHLSEKQMLEESLSSFAVNMQIKEYFDKKENRELKKARRKAKR